MKPDKSDTAMRLHAAAIHLLRRVREEDRRTGMSPARLSVLSILVFAGPRTLKQLTDMEQVAAPTMTKLVAGLERDGYVQRAADPDDGRAWIIRATRKAKDVLERGRARRIASLMKLLENLSAEEWQTLNEAVVIIDDALRSDSR